MELGNKKFDIEMLQNAMKEGNDEAVKDAFLAFQDNIVEEIKRDAMEYQATQDKAILAQRGYRQLTKAEEKYYDVLITASKCKNAQQAFTTLASNEDLIMPETIIDDVFRELVNDHPLLTKINFQNAKYMVKMILNDHTIDAAVWGEIEGEITKEIVSAFKVVELSQNKLSAFAQIPLGLLDLGKEYLDRYIRTVLKDALAVGLEKAIVSGTGKGQPIGLDRDIHKGVSVSDGVYPQKEAIAITAFNVKQMGALIAKMGKNEDGKNRSVGKLSLIVNSNDYYTLVAPAVRVQNMAGAYVDNFAFPCEVVISDYVEAGKAIFADLSKYFMGMGFNKEGALDFSDEFAFLADKRTYKIKTYGMGKALDDNCALLLDISGLEEAVLKVKNTGATA